MLPDRRRASKKEPKRIPPRVLLEYAVGTTGRRMDALAGDLRAGKLTVRQWWLSMQGEVKDLYPTAALLGKREVQPSVRRLAEDEREWVERAVARQFKYLRRFRRDVDSLVRAQGRENLPDRIESRARLYAQSAESAYWRARSRALPSETQVFWRLTAEAEHCPVCLKRAARHRGSYQRPWTVRTLRWWPRDGTTPCLTNCACWLEYRTLAPA